MFGMAAPLAYLLLSWAVVTMILVVLLIYRKIVSAEENRFYGKRLEDERLITHERSIMEKLNRLKRSTVPLAVLSGVLLLASVAVWIWMGLTT
jgi:hypothetical protein